MVRTQLKRVPWRWAAYLALMSAGVQFAQHNAGVPLTLTVHKFIERPWLLVVILGINNVLSAFIAPYSSWKADRIWTRWGRRKPFMIAGWSMMILGLIIAPLANNIYILVAGIVIWYVAFDFGYMGIWTPLCYEVVPSPQRGRFQVIRRLIGIPLGLSYTWFLIRQFEDLYRWNLSTQAFALPAPTLSAWHFPFTFWFHIPLPDFAKWAMPFHWVAKIGIPGAPTLHLTGSHVCFFSGVVALVLLLLMLMFGLKETKPDKPVPQEKFALGTYFLSLFGERQWRMIYLLIFCVACMTAGLSALGALLTTEQFGYRVKDLGMMATVTTILDLIIILPVAAFIVDRFNRFKIFQWGLFLSTLHPISYWLFVKFMVPNHIPSIPWIIAFGMFNAVVDGTATIALEPLIYDLIPRNMMGTVNSGFLLIRHILGIFITYGVGFWVSGYTWVFGTVPSPTKGTCPDYMSGFLYVFALGVAGCIVCWYFGRELKSGRIIQYGKLEDEAGETGKGYEQSEKAETDKAALAAAKRK